ncbi:hypothetical protein F444_07616 [Phytophthora nicotianae P1976]|uniref:Auto-transporter adhesin head GIN domain-containing protein n=1 Tax=Phytophthora nicotianae P1976 TaxID=1317066 RepID=A0A081AE40_PHYNI|nr:hypothetical protein F444_07616 [Phytophthora nicotianae P1976]
MKTDYLQVLVTLVAASVAACTKATISVSSSSTGKVSPSTDLSKYAKQWTVSGSGNADKIDAIVISLAGNVFVSYTDGLPKGVLGYLNVTGDSQAVVDAVTVTYKQFLNVTAAATPTGHVLTELLLSSNGAVTLVDCSRAANVVIEEGVLTTDADLLIDVSDSSAVYVSAADTAFSTKDLTLDVSGSASLQLRAKSMSAGSVVMNVEGSASISVLSPLFESDDLTLDTASGGTICIDAKEVTTGDYWGEGASKISMPKASDKHGSTGTFACEGSSIPVRGPDSVPSASMNSNTSSSTTADTSKSSRSETSPEESSSSALRKLDLKEFFIVGLALMAIM